MSKISVVIPTARRPGMLLTALTSVRGQTALGCVDRVIVSENGGDLSSKDVCAQFPDVPIQYLVQDPPLTAVEHVHRLLTRPDLGDYTAMLCDDDWWTPGHLATLVAGLERHPEAVAAFGAFGHTPTEAAAVCLRYWPAVMWLQADPSGSVRQQCFSGDEVLAACWVHTPFHFSALMVRTEPLRHAAATLRTTHPAYADRLLFARLALVGPCVFEPAVSVLARRHDGNYYRSTPQAELERTNAEARRLVSELANQAGRDITQTWRRLLESRQGPLPSELVTLLWDYAGRKTLESTGLMSFLSRGPLHYWIKRFERATWQVLVPLAPPLLHRAYLRARDRLGRSQKGPPKQPEARA